MEQGSVAWLKWRKEGIGASDAPIIMGTSPHRKIHQLYEDKTREGEPEQVQNYILDLGNKIEPIARARYEIKVNLSMRPALVTHWWNTIMRCSLDGVNWQARGGLEIKLLGKEDFERLQEGIIPAKYIHQLAHQFFCTGLEWIDLQGYYLKPEHKADHTYLIYGKDHHHRCTLEEFMPIITEYLPHAKEFWRRVTAREPYPIPEKKSRKKKIDLFSP